MKTLLWVARHGTTTDSGKNIFRGQRNSALDQKGFTDAHELHKFFSDKDWHRVFSSDLIRAVQTAIVLVGDRTDEIMQPVIGLRPWDIGYLTGKPKQAYYEDMNWFIDHPDEVPERGESRNQFERGRVHLLLAEAIEMGEKAKPPIIIGHSSVVHSLSHLIYGEKHKDLAVKPGGVIEVYLKDGEIEARCVLKAGKDDSSFAASS